MAIRTNLEEFKLLVDLVSQYEELDEIISADEFLKNKVSSDSPVAEMTGAKFVLLCRHLKVFNKLTHIISESENICQSFGKQIKVLLFGVILYFDMVSYKEVIKCFGHVGWKKSLKILKYFTEDNRLIELIQVFCSEYCTDYVLANMLQSIVNKMRMLEMLQADIEQRIKAMESVPKKKLTDPKGPQLLSRSRLAPQVPINTPYSSKVHLSRKVPLSVYRPPKKLERDLKKAREENLKKAYELLKKAQTASFKCATEKTFPPPPSPPEEYVFKANAAPPKTDIVIRSTAASLMRQAATLCKEETKGLKVLENVISGAYDPSNLNQMEDEIRREIAQENAKLIEKRHLEGLLTYEEAILAKKKLARENEEKVQQMKQDRTKIVKEINAWHEAEEKKLRVIVEEIKGIDKKAREAEKKILSEKQRKAKLQDYETKKLLQEVLERQKAELNRKMHLIQELRAMHQIRELQPKEFDPTECPNFGLLCEMSIAELNERLVLLRLEMKEQLDAKRDSISKNKMRQRMMLEDAKNFISQTRMSKPKPLPSTPPKMEQTPDLVALRERLERARSMRMSTS